MLRLPIWIHPLGTDEIPTTNMLISPLKACHILPRTAVVGSKSCSELDKRQNNSRGSRPEQTERKYLIAVCCGRTRVKCTALL
jgi:hypothetical protein